MIHAVVLGAGRSRRMGEGVQKLLLPFGGDTVIGRVVGEVHRSPIDRALVVVGADADRVRDALADLSPDFVTNPDPAGDMLSSVRCGLRALPAPCEAVLVVLGDQPSITSDLIGRMLDAFRRSERGIVVPVHRGKRGHPLLFAGRFRREVLTRHDGVGLRGLLRAHPQEVLELETSDSSVLADVDYPEDYRRELARLKGRGRP